MSRFFIAAACALLLALPLAARAASSAQVLGDAVAVTIPFAAAPGEIVSYDGAAGTYRLAGGADDASVFGVAAADSPIVLFSSTAASGTPVVRSGTALVDVTLENGPIAAGNGIIASSHAGMGMRANAASTHVIGTAVQSFDGSQATSTVTIGGRTVPAGVILVALTDIGGGVSGESGGVACTAGSTACAIAAKINAAPLVALVRYLLAAALAIGSLFVAFRIFVSNAINGVVSIGRNPRAKGAIQAMIILNALLAAFIMVAGVGAGIAILLVQA